MRRDIGGDEIIHMLRLLGYLFFFFITRTMITVTIITATIKSAGIIKSLTELMNCSMGVKTTSAGKVKIFMLKYLLFKLFSVYNPHIMSHQKRCV